LNAAAENLQQNVTQPQPLDELSVEEISVANSSGAIFAFKAPPGISQPVPISSQVLSSSQKKQSVIVTPSNDTDKDKHTPVATLTNPTITVTVKRGRCKHPRIPTPFPVFSKPPQLEKVGEKQEHLQPPLPNSTQPSQLMKKSKKEMQEKFGSPLLCSTNVGLEIPACSEERLEKARQDLVKEGVLIETVDEGQEQESGKRKQLPDIDCSSEDSSYLYLRRKLPMAKRRRIPASTRPEIMSTTFSPDDTPPRRPKRR